MISANAINQPANFCRFDAKKTGRNTVLFNNTVFLSFIFFSLHDAFRGILTTGIPSGAGVL